MLRKPTNHAHKKFSVNNLDKGPPVGSSYVWPCEPSQREMFLLRELQREDVFARHDITEPLPYLLFLLLYDPGASGCS